MADRLANTEPSSNQEEKKHIFIDLTQPPTPQEVESDLVEIIDHEEQEEPAIVLPPGYNPFPIKKYRPISELEAEAAKKGEAEVRRQALVNRLAQITSPITLGFKKAVEERSRYHKEYKPKKAKSRSERETNWTYPGEEDTDYAGPKYIYTARYLKHYPNAAKRLVNKLKGRYEAPKATLLSVEMRIKPVVDEDGERDKSEKDPILTLEFEGGQMARINFSVEEYDLDKNVLHAPFLKSGEMYYGEQRDLYNHHKGRYVYANPFLESITPGDRFNHSVYFRLNVSFNLLGQPSYNYEKKAHNTDYMKDSWQITQWERSDMLVYTGEDPDRLKPVNTKSGWNGISVEEFVNLTRGVLDLGPKG